tara:strand:+ start:6711 stop:6869 length:159 start_codon:yes stop_codon:yes gene_type:complete
MSDDIDPYEVATIEEWRAFLRSDGFYTAPEFLAEKFYLKTGKIPPQLGDEEE